MKLEDAFLYVRFRNGLAGDALVDACGEAVAGGGDVVEIAARDEHPDDAATARRIAELCRNEEALLIVRGSAELAVDVGASGVCVVDEQQMGIVRAVVGDERIVGLDSTSLDGARLSLEIGADYLLHHAGTACAAEFAALKHEARVPLFAAGLTGLGDAESLLANEVFRWCVDVNAVGREDLAAQVAQYARLLGRCL